MIWRRAAIVFAAGTLVACSGGRAPRAGTAAEDAAVVSNDPESLETDYTIAAGDCRITWTVFRTEANRGVIRHRADCGLPLAGQAPLIRQVLRKILRTDAAAAEFRALMWGRLYPDGAREATMAARLALAAKRSPEWDAAKGAPRDGDPNGCVRKLANEAMIYRELQPVFAQAGLEIRLTSVEKVLVEEAARLAFFRDLRAAGARPGDKLPFDCQVWFSVRKAGGAAP
jgi:hypothetical protein